MNGILGMVDLALDANPPTDIREYLESIKESAYSLLRLLNDVLDFSRIEARRIELEKIPFNLRDMVEHAVSSLAVQAEKRDSSLSVDLLLSSPIVIEVTLAGFVRFCSIFSVTLSSLRMKEKLRSPLSY